MMDILQEPENLSETSLFSDHQATIRKFKQFRLNFFEITVLKLILYFFWGGGVSYWWLKELLTSNGSPPSTDVHSNAEFPKCAWQ